MTRLTSEVEIRTGETIENIMIHGIVGDTAILINTEIMTVEDTINEVVEVTKQGQIPGIAGENKIEIKQIHMAQILHGKHKTKVEGSGEEMEVDTGEEEGMVMALINIVAEETPTDVGMVIEVVGATILQDIKEIDNKK